MLPLPTKKVVSSHHSSMKPYDNLVELVDILSKKLFLNNGGINFYFMAGARDTTSQSRKQYHIFCLQ